MAMTKREKLLAFGVGTVVGLAGLQYGISGIRSGFELKQSRIDALQQEVDGKQQTILRGTIALQKLRSLQTKSLPSDRERARFDYGKWLMETVQSVGLSEPTTSATQELPVRGAYTNYNYVAKGEGSIDQITKLLYKFYEKDYLHRIKSMKLTPGKEPGRMLVQLDIESIALAIADLKQPPPQTPSKRVPKPLEEYLTAITRRNMYAPENKAPKLVSSSREKIEIGKSAEKQLKAEDPDKGQTVSYEAIGELPEGISFDKATGKWSWTPNTKGTFSLLVRATDSGFPAKSVEQKLEIEVVDPPPPPPPEEPKFDVGSQTFITAILSGRRGPEAWVFSRTDNRSKYVAQGDELEVGKIKGKVVEIGKDFIVVESDGRRWTAGMDESIAESYKKGQVD